MAWNKRPVIVFLTLVFLFSSLTLRAQEPGYFVDYENGQPRIFQRLVWNREEFVSDYEVEIDLYGRGFFEFLTERTEDNFLEVDLPPGRYRYSVTPYDLLGRRGYTSAWNEFTVIQAFMPVIRGFTPDTIYITEHIMDRTLKKVLDISGENFLESSEVYLVNDQETIHPVEINIISAGMARLVFDDTSLVEGKYEILVKNPGGLEARAGKFFISYQKALNTFLKIAYNPVIPISGGPAEILGSNLFLSGVSLRLEFISSKRNTFNGGLELAASAFVLDPAFLPESFFEDFGNNFQGSGTGVTILDFAMNISLQKWFFGRRLAFSFRFGYGAALLSGSQEFDLDGITVNFNLDASALFLIHNTLYLEAGTGFSYYNAKDPFSLIKPRLGLVWRL